MHTHANISKNGEHKNSSNTLDLRKWENTSGYDWTASNELNMKTVKLKEHAHKAFCVCDKNAEMLT